MSAGLMLTGAAATIKLTLAAIHVSGGSQASIAFDAADFSTEPRRYCRQP